MQMMIQNGITNTEVKNSSLVINAYHNDAFSQGGVVQRSLKYLCPQNADLIKLLLRDCLKTQYTEKELLQLELQRNLDGNRLLNCYGFSVPEIKKRCSCVWESRVHISGTNQTLSRYYYSTKFRRKQNPDEFLYWTFLLLLQGGCENPYPFTLYKMIQSQRLFQYYSIVPLFIRECSA